MKEFQFGGGDWEIWDVILRETKLTWQKLSSVEVPRRKPIRAPSANIHKLLNLHDVWLKLESASKLVEKTKLYFIYDVWLVTVGKWTNWVEGCPEQAKRKFSALDRLGTKENETRIQKTCFFTVLVSLSKAAKNRQACSPLTFSFWYSENLPLCLEETTFIRVSPYQTIVSAILIKFWMTNKLLVVHIKDLLFTKKHKNAFATTCRVLREKICKISCGKMIGEVFTWISLSGFGPPVTRPQKIGFLSIYYH